MLQKSIFTTFLLIGMMGLSVAQPVINTTVLPNIGDVVQLTIADTLNVSTGNAGANQTWNFASWKKQSGTTPTEYQYVSPTGTPYAADYPTATIVTKVNDDTITYAYFREQANQFALLGSGSLAYIQEFSDPDAQLKFPTNYNGTYQDDFAYTTDAGTGILFFSKGSRTTKYDAYGTLTTPLGTFQNAMRIKAVSVQTDSAVFFGTELVNQTFITTYGWLAAGHPGSVASVYFINTISETRIPGFDTITTVSPVTKSANFISNSSVGIFEPTHAVDGIFDLSLGPNPAITQLSLRFNASIAKQNLQLSLTDVNGRLLHSEIFDATTGENVKPLNVSQFAPGNYFLTLSDGKGSQGMCWIKQ